MAELEAKDYAEFR